MARIAYLKLARCCRLLTVLTGADAETGSLTDAEQALVRQACNGTEPRMVARSRTQVDVGHWLGDAPVCVAVAGNELVVCAPGKRPFIARVPIVELSESQYNHVTGELLLAPAPSAVVRRLNVPPVEGRQLLEAIQGKGN